MAAKPQTKPEQQEKIIAPEVFVGRKPPLSYAFAASTALKENGKVIMKARGLKINTLVSAAEILRRRIVQEAVIEKIEIGTEEVETRNGRKPRSSMTITISLPGKK